MHKLIPLFLCLLLAAHCGAGIITVDDDGPADFSSIQAAIGSASDGDTIIVQPGLYQESINFLGKNIALVSTNPENPNVVAETIVDWDDPWDPAVVFRGTEDETCTLSGFNINGHIVGVDWFFDPNAENKTHASISHCLLVGNCGSCGTVIMGCDGTISNCVIADNGFSCERCLLPVVLPGITGCHALFKNCTIVNTGFMEFNGGGAATIENCIVYNTAVEVREGATVDILYSNIQGGLEGIYLPWPYSGVVNWGPGNIDADPKFALAFELVSWLVSRWKFDEGEGDTAYDSVGSNDGAVSGAVWTTGKFGGALSFNGVSNFVQLGTPENLTNLPLDDFTVSAWIYENYYDGQTLRTILGCYDRGYGWSLRTYSNGGGQTTLYFQATYGDQGTWANFRSSNGTMSQNEWCHVALVWDASKRKAKLCINGTEPSYQTYHAGVGNYNGDGDINKEIGRIPHVDGGGMQYFNGIVDEVRIYDRALSTEEVRQDFFGNQLVRSDYRLQSEAGRWDPNTNSWVTDANTSPCIDAGNPGCPLGAESSDAKNVRINMGAYGGTATASKSPANWLSIADLTNDWAVDFNDLAVFVDYWLESGECVPSDLDRSQSVDFGDFGIFADE